jgi:hypothetical protein
MAIGGEIKVTLTLDDSGFTLKTKQAKSTSDALNTGLKDLASSAKNVDAPLASAAKTMEQIAGKLSDFASGFKNANAEINPVQKSVQAVAQSMSALAGGLQQAGDIAAKAGKNIGAVGEAAAASNKGIEQTAAAAGTLAANFDKSVPALLRAREGLQQAGAAAQTAGAQVNAANNGVAASAGKATAALLSTPNAAMRAALANAQLGNSANAAAKGTNAQGTAAGKANTSNTALANAMTRLEKAVSTLAGTVTSLVTANRTLAAATDKNTLSTDALTRATSANTAATNAQAIATRNAGQNFTNVRGQADMLTDSLKAMAGVWAGMKIEKGIRGSIDDAAQMQTAQVGLHSLGMSDQQNQEFMSKAFDLTKTNAFLSQLDAVKARMAAIGSVGSNNQQIIDATLQTAVRAANNLQTLGYSHGDMQNTIRNLYGVVETRQQVYDPAAAKGTMDLVQKISTATGGKVTMQDMENVLRMMGTGASRLSDDGLINLMSIVDQNKTMGGGMGGGGAGVSRVGTSFKMFQQYALGKQMTDQATQIFLDSGLLNTGAVTSNDPRQMKQQAKHAGLIDADLAMANPVKWLQDHYSQLLAFTQKKQNQQKYYEGADVNDERAQSIAIARLLAALGIQTTAATAMSQSIDPHSAQRINEQREFVKQNKGVDAVNDEVMKNYDGAVQGFKASVKDLGIIIGNSVLPQVTKLVGYMRDFLVAAREFAQNNPMVTQLSVIGAAVGGAVLAIRGFLSITGTIGGVFKALGAGLGGMGAGAATAAASTTAATATMGGAFAGLVARVGAFVAETGALFMRAIPYVGWLLVAWDLAGIIGNLEVGGHKVSDWFVHWFDSILLNAGTFWTDMKKIFSDIASWKFDPKQWSGVVGQMVAGEAAAGNDSGKIHAKVNKDGSWWDGVKKAFTGGTGATFEDAKAQAAERERLFNGGYSVRGDAGQMGPQRPVNVQHAPAAAELGDADPAIKNALTSGGHKTREFEDPFVKFIEQLKAKGSKLSSDIDALLTRQPKGMEALRRDATEDFTAKWLGGDFDKAHDPRNRKWKKADGSLDTNNADVKAAIDQIAKDKELEEQKKALVFANERLASTENDLQAAQEAAADDGAAKQTREMRALERELARAEERLGTGTKAWAEWTKRKDQALANRAGADLLNFSSKFKQSDAETMQNLLPFASQRTTAKFDSQTSKDLAQYSLDMKTQQDASAAAIAAETDPQKRADMQKQATALQLQAEQEFNQHLAVVAAERKRLLESPMDGLVRSWQDTYAQMQQAEASWATNAIDMIMEFVKTGKLNIGKLAESMALDVLKIKLQETFSTPLKAGLDALTSGINKLVFPNASTAAGQASTASDITGAGSAAYAFAMPAATQQATDALKSFTQQGVGQATAAMGQQVTGLATATTTQATTTSALGSLATAAYGAASALAAVGGGSGLGGLGSSLGGLFGASNTGSAAGYSFTMPNSSSISGSGALFGTSAGMGLGAFADGGIMTSRGVAQLRKYANGGIANSPQLALYGEGSMNEAYVPLPDGRSIPVTIKTDGTAASGDGAASSGSTPTITVNVINQTGQSVGAQQQGSTRFDGKQMILDVVLTSAQSPGSFRDGLRSAMK